MPGIGLGVTARRGASPALLASLPSLDLDFTKQSYQVSLIGKAFSEIFTFSRASTGTRINASGVMETIAANQPRFDYDTSGALFNLLTWSNNRANGAWFGGGLFTVNSATNLSFSGPAYHVGQIVGLAGQTYTQAVKISGTPGSVVSIYVQDNGGAYASSNQSITLTATPTLYVVSRAVTTNGILFGVSSGGAIPSIEIESTGLFLGTVTTSQILAAGGIPLTTSAPAWGGITPKGILIEEQRTNRVINSQTVPLGANGGGGSIVTVTDMGGGISQIAKTGTGGFAEAVTACDMGGNIGDSFTVSNSCWVRIVSGSAADIYFGVGQNMFPYATLRDSLSSLGVIADGNWYAVKNTKTMSTIGDRNLRLASFGFNVATAATIQVKCIQGEISAFASSHIPTAGSQVTRVAELQTEVLAPWFNPSKGTVVWIGDVNAIVSSRWLGLFSFDDGAFANRLGAYVNPNGTVAFTRRVSGASIEVVSANAVTAGSRFKVACSWDSTNLYISLNGGVVVSYPHGGLPTVSRLVHGKLDDYLNGHEAGLKYLPKTTTGAALQVLSA